MSLALQKWVLDNPWKAILMSMVVVIASSTGLKNFENDGDPRTFFGEDNPLFQQFLEIEEDYAGNEMVSFIVHPKNDNVFTRETLHVIEKLTEDAWMTPYSTRVDSLSNFQHSTVIGDEMYVEYLIEDAMSFSDEKVAELEKIVMGEPALQNSLISSKGHVAGIFVRVFMEDQNTEAAEVVLYAEKLRDQYRAEYPDVEFMMTGTVPFSYTAQQATQDEMLFTMPIGFGVVILLLLAMLRSISLTVITLVLVVFSITSGVGLGTWSGIVFSPMVGAAPAMILTLAVANSVHILVGYLQERRAGKIRYDAMFESLRVNMQPVFLTSSTTAVGFLCLNFSESPPFHDMGNMVAIGVMVAFGLSMVLMPALVMVAPDKEYKPVQGFTHRMMVGFGDWVIRAEKPLFWGMAVVIVVVGSFVTNNELNDVWNEYFDETFEVRRANDFMMKELTGMNRLDFSIPANPDIEQGVMDPVYQKKLNEFTLWAKAQPNVVSVSTYSDIVKRLNRDMHQADEAFYTIPDQRELISQYTLLYEMSLPMGLGIDNQITMDKMKSLVSVVATDLNSQQVIDLERACSEWIDQNFPSYMKTTGTGLDLLFGSLALENIKSMITGTVMALLLVSALLIFALKSLKYGLLSLLPNLLPAAMAFGIWGIFVGQVGLPAAIVASITIGIVVDDTVHFLSKYVRAKREYNYDTTEAVRYAFSNVGVALVFTSILLTANFGVMAFSHFQPNASMGTLTALTIAMALVVDFLFFVPVLLVIDRYASGEKTPDKEAEAEAA
ncbi:MAG: hypothetical protein COB51_13455 [Moraxellaceae bacterium]|nr:MAG: hypothetical protein COB51_13455 [Moraxellaceae bacterium]